MSVMILGASGRLGRALWESRPQTLEVTALTHAELDVTDIRAVEAVIALARPDVVINAAAWTDVAGAQTNAAAARAVNAVAPGAMGVFSPARRQDRALLDGLCLFGRGFLTLERSFRGPSQTGGRLRRHEARGGEAP